ncbi:metal ABC transporter substrate-binding protein [Corynebacterium pilosum]|uniref:Manganese ABC transporter substrate-binding lipoprotein n=1 Tax=Corynebacterium pilosum TaxID=35756 RepID=A0A376CN13_9CORY|nr:metal ABC transporter substrate-binding protein [Corynebacterium pilosum]STC69723.1 manganese ABC transporter substrate-binding lipoprotein [Corynebacterium pilosum]
MRILAAALAVALGTGLASCSVSDSEQASDDTLDIFATTGYIADAAANIAPDANVVTLVGPGGDPHTYQPSTKDIETMSQSDVVLWNGLYLEAQMIDQLESFGDKQIAVAEAVDEDMLLGWDDTDDEGNALHDPHVWNSPLAWQQVVDAIATKLGEIDPERADEYAANAEKYNQEISAKHEEVAAMMKDVPEPRILVTGHDAFAYFGDTYDLEVRATDFISTEAALSATELSELADYIADNKVPVIFQDNQANPQAITSLKEAVESRGWSVTVSTEELFADSLGPTAPTDTYLGVLEHNATTVSEGLK